MIAMFPKPYKDELVYSVLARYYVKSGYLAYRYVAEDVFCSPTVRPDTNFLNTFTEDIRKALTRYKTMEQIVLKHTMFSYYGRFLPQKRRNKAFEALVHMRGNYNNLLPMPQNRNTHTIRYLRYCPLCVKSDREKYGETYWHRTHQMQGVNICSTHRCYLLNSEVIVSGKTSPSLICADEMILENTPIQLARTEIECRLAEYITQVFHAQIDLQSSVLCGDFLHTRLYGTKYLSVRGEQRNIGLLYADFIACYRDLPANTMSELWMLQKVLTNDKYHMAEICMLALFLDVSVDELVNMRLPEKSQEQLFDDTVLQMREQGYSYPVIADKLGASIHTVKGIRALKHR